MDELWRLEAVELAALVSSRKVSAEEVTRAHLERTAAVEPSVQAFLLTTPNSRGFQGSNHRV